MAARESQEKPAERMEPERERRQTLPEYLRQLRISSHYRQNFVASRLNISRQTYSHYETGRIRPPAGALYGLARLYGIPVENLLSRMMLGRYGLENREEGVERRPEQNHENSGDGNPAESKESRKDLKKDSAEGERGSSLEIRLLARFRSLTQREQEDILSIMELKIKDKEEKENQDAERKVTV